MHKIHTAIFIYVDKNDGEWPDSIEQVKDNLDADVQLKEVMTNPATGDNPGYEYVKPKGNWSASDFDGEQVILYQLRDGKRDTSLKVGYADGSVRAFKQ